MTTKKRKGKWNNINIAIYYHNLQAKIQSTLIKIKKGSKNFCYKKYFQDNIQKKDINIKTILYFNDIYQSKQDKKIKFEDIPT